MRALERDCNEVLAKLKREINTYVEVSGVKGVSESRYELFAPFSANGVNQIAADYYAKGTRLIETVGASFDTLRELQGYLAKAKAATPVDDRTHSQEEENQRIADRKKEQEIHETARVALIDAGNKARSKAPPWAKKAIIAELHVDKSDSQTDYFASEITRRLLIGWRSGLREDFSLMRMAAHAQPETAHLAERKYEQRQTYSMGRGYFLAADNYSGWHVRAVSMHQLDDWEFEDRTPEPVKLPDDGKIVVRDNPARDGIEIIYPWIPAAEVRKEMRDAGFWWSGPQKLWYARRSPATVELAHTIAARPYELVKSTEEWPKRKRRE